MDTKVQDLRIERVHNTVPDKIIRQQHYLRSTPAGARYRFIVTTPTEYIVRRIVGAVLVGRPVSRHQDDGRTLEITRFWMADECPKNSESYVLARILRFIRKEGYQRVIAYADPKAGHTGTIYRAVGFVQAGMTKGGNWNTRPTCKAGRQGTKIRYVWKARRPETEVWI